MRRSGFHKYKETINHGWGCILLVLTRRPNESIVCTIPEGIEAGSQIVIKVVSVKQGRVRLGFVAPREIGLHRLEVHERMNEEPTP